MSPRKLIAWFFVRLVVLYALLMVTWPGVEETYARAFRWCGTKLLGDFGSRGVVWLVPGPRSDLTHDTDLFVQNRETGAGLGLGVSSRYVAYLPTAFLISLIVATPLSVRRRAWALLWGLLVVHGVAVMELIIVAVYGFSLGSPPVMYHLSDFWGRTLAATVQIIGVSPFTWLVVPTFIWVLVTFRHGDLVAMLETGPRAGNL